MRKTGTGIWEAIRYQALKMFDDVRCTLAIDMKLLSADYSLDRTS